MGKFSKQEFFIGLAAVVTMIFVLKWTVIFTCAASGLLWMLGGTYWKPIRRYGVPFVVWLHVEIMRGWPATDLLPVAAFVLGVAVLHIGDGFPDHRPETADKGSWLGRFVEKHIDERDHIGGPITKWLIPVIFQVSLIPYWILR